MLLSLARPVTYIQIPAISVILFYIYIFINLKIKAEKQEIMDELSESNLKFGLDILKTIAAHKKGGNIFVSPFSIQTVMAMLHLGTRNSSKTELETALYFKSDSIHGSLGKYLELLNEKEASYALSSANRVFINNKFSFIHDYLTKIKDLYKAEADTCDFGGNPEGEKEKINKWVEEATSSKIKDLIPSGMFNALTAMVLVNAVYFKGSWENKFEVEDTVNGKFKVDAKTYVEVPMMKMTKKFNYGHSSILDCSILELPYVKKDLSMFFILPQKIDGLASLEEKLTSGSIQPLIKEMHSVKVDVTLPRFKLETSIDLKSMLLDLGMKDIFDESKADLSGIDGTKNLHVSAALHKAFLEVNEEGTEAAAATGVVIMTRSLPVIQPFHADHPFLFFIKDNRADMILFWGRLMKPDGNPVTTSNEEL